MAGINYVPQFVKPVDTASPPATAGIANLVSVPAYNFRNDNMRRWRAARARVVSGVGRGRVLCFGDSTTAGVGATDSTGRLRQSWVYYMTQALSSQGVTAINKSIVGYQGVSSGNYATYNSELTINSGWGANTNSTIGGQPWFNNSTTNTLDWTVPGTTDSLQFYHVGGFDRDLFVGHRGRRRDQRRREPYGRRLHQEHGGHVLQRFEQRHQVRSCVR